MKKTLLYSAAGLLLFAASCKEHVIPIDTNIVTEWDTTYVETPGTPENRRLLIEELSGVTCVNCPQGTEVLEQLSTQYPGQLSIITIHTGNFTDPIEGKSTQNFQTDDGIKLRNQVWYGQGSKPTAIFDRLFLGSGENKYFLDGYSGWANAIVQDKAAHPTTPLNLTVTSEYDDINSLYRIKVLVKYTSAVNAKHSLNIFLSESKIIDCQEFSPTNYDMNYEFNHVFRKAITNAATGKIVAASLGTDMKEAGRVYEYHTVLKIDPNDAKQKFWVPANMTVVAFVTDQSSTDKHVIHVKDVKL
jgi:hypothetical protein